MKIGILTFHNAINLGAVLQAYALNYYIEKNIGQCEIINFIPNSDIPRIPYILSKNIRGIRVWLKDRELYRKEAKFKRFKSYIDISKKVYIGDQGILNSSLDYDILISGSDQIFNMTLTGNSISYYLNFFNGKKISYASSFGRKEVSEAEIKAIHSELPKFSALSVREQSAGEIIKREIGKEPQLVLDPVFLLSKHEWIARCNEDISLPGEYIFVYSMEVSSALEQAAKYVQTQTGLPVIVVRGGGRPGLITGMEDSACGPEEFLRYIRDAKMVITNSFHGTAFSLIFEKKFICVAHSTRNTRLDNILNLINQRDKMIITGEENYDEKIICGSKCISDLERYISLSKVYLQQSVR